MKYTQIEYEHFKGNIVVTEFEIDEKFFEAMLKFPAAMSGGSAYNTFAYQLAEEMVSGLSSFAYAGKTGIIGGFGKDASQVAEAMYKVAGQEGMMDESEVAQMKEAFANKRIGNGAMQQPDQVDPIAQPTQPTQPGMSDAEKDRLRRLGGVDQ